MLFIYGYKKSGGYVLTHLATGIAKHQNRNELETITHRRICSHISAVSRMHAYYIQVSVVLQSSFGFIEIGDFVTKDESGKRSLDQVAVIRFKAEWSTRRGKFSHFF